jgi:predicted DNA-binding transcriptional regulator AlpA
MKENNKITERLLTPKQVAVLFSVGQKTIQRWTKLKWLKGIYLNSRTIRFDRDQINQAIKDAALSSDAPLQGTPLENKNENANETTASLPINDTKK